MALSNFRFRSTTEPSRPVNLFRESSRYDGPNLYRYPIDLGVASKEHYMIIHINEQRRTMYPSELSNDLPTVLSNIQLYGGSNLYQSTIIPGVEYAGDKTKQYTQKLGLPRGDMQTIRRTTDTIALYMPDTLNFGYNQEYSELRLSGLPTAALASGISVVDAYKELRAGGVNLENILNVIGKNTGSFVAPLLSQLAQTSELGRIAFGGYFGFVQNPQIEMLYSSPRMREFNFEFMFYPRSEMEAKQVQAILAMLRFHQAPEVVREYKGFFLTPPSEFDIKFYYNGVENPNIPKISTCVLHTINVDYAPHGFAAYENLARIDPTLGETGMPVAIRLTLGFKEREILTKAHFAADAKKVRRPDDREPE